MENFPNYSRISLNEVDCSRMKFRIFELEIEISFVNIKAQPEKNYRFKRNPPCPIQGDNLIMENNYFYHALDQGKNHEL